MVFRSAQAGTWGDERDEMDVSETTEVGRKGRVQIDSARTIRPGRGGMIRSNEEWEAVVVFGVERRA